MFSSIALDSEGVTHSMGRNEYGRIGLGEGKDASQPTPIPVLQEKKAVTIGAGECVSFAVLENGKSNFDIKVQFFNHSIIY